MKLYEIVLEEHIGEKEWTHHHLFYAKTLRLAQKKANQFAKTYWSSWEDNEPVHKNEDGAYEFNGGGIIVNVEDVREITKEQFCQKAFERALIN
jgi:hypothetical protein